MAQSISGHLTYKGDHRHLVGGGPMGPNTLGERFWPIEAEYDAEADTTRVGFTHIEPAVVTA